jgi:hypothetical protein
MTADRSQVNTAKAAVQIAHAAAASRHSTAQKPGTGKPPSQAKGP